MPLREHKRYKDWFNEEAAQAWARQVSSVYSQFDSELFVRIVTRGLGRLEFKQRVLRFARALRETLPQDIPDAMGVLVECFPEPLPDCDSPNDGWLQWPAGEFIALYGLEHPEDSLEAMEVLTQVFTAEFAVRPFVARYPEQTLAHLLSLVEHPSPHVRRWCSEGLRPRLPWGRVLRHLVEDPGPIFPVLETLKDDPELYVRRSVANNLNDISKDHPELLLDLCRQWLKGASEERRWGIKHALRTLTRQGHPGALALQGFGPVGRSIGVALELSSRTLVMGEEIVLTATLSNSGKKALRLQLDYVLHLVRRRGKMNEKVFKWKSLELGPGEALKLTRNHRLEPNTQRRLYPGTHAVEVQLNGERFGRSEFHLF